MPAHIPHPGLSRRVIFSSSGTRLVGDLFLPPNFKGEKPLPGLVITGAWTTVKEQMPRRYAIELAARGFASLAFDFRGFGQSEGAIRQYEHPGLKTEDIMAAADFLATCPEVDPTRLAGLGICASSGYMADAVGQSSTLKALGLVAPWLHNRSIAESVYGGPEGYIALVEEGRKAVETYGETGHQQMIPAASLTDKTAAMFQAPYYTEADRGLIPEYRNEFFVGSWEPWLTYDAISKAEPLNNKPVQLVHSEAAAIPQGAHAFFDAVTGPKNELWLSGVTQFDFYDQSGPVSLASDKIASSLQEVLQ